MNQRTANRLAFLGIVVIAISFVSASVFSSLQLALYGGLWGGLLMALAPLLFVGNTPSEREKA